MAGKDVAKVEETLPDNVVEVAAGIIPRDNDVISRYLMTEREDVEVTREATHAAIIGDIMTATTVDDVLEVLEPEELDVFQDRHIRIDGFDQRDSEYEAGAPIYVTLKVFDEEHKSKHLINTGQQAIIAQMLKLHALNAFPVHVVPTASKRPNKFGRYMFRLKKWEG